MVGGEGEGQGLGGLRSEEEIGGGLLGFRSDEEVEQRHSSGLQVFIEARYTGNTDNTLETLLSNQKHLISLPSAPLSNLWPENELKAAPGPILPPSISRRTWESNIFILMIGWVDIICPTHCLLETDHISWLEVDQCCGSAL